MDDWEQRKAKEICSISTGKGNTQDKIDNGKYPFYVRSATIERSNDYLYDQEAVLTVGDGVGTGKVFHYVNGKYNLHQRVYRMFDFNSDVSTKYFYYYFSKKFYRRVMAMTAKTSVDSVRLEMIADMIIKFPSVKEQKKIVKLFESLDDTIALHQEAIQRQQDLKKALLQKLFPVNRERIPTVRFATFKEEWEQRKLGDFYFFKNGLNKEKEFFGKGIPIVNFTDVFHNRGIYSHMLNGKVTLSASEIERYKIAKGDLFFTRTSEVINEIGMNSVMLDDVVDTVFSGFVLRGRSIDKDPLDNFFKKYVFSTSTFRNEMIKKSSMTTRALTSGTALREMYFYYPTETDEQRKIGNFLTSLENTIALHQQALDKLKLLKQSLLQKMFV